MNRRKPPSDSVLARVAEARAEGGNWEAAAKKVSRSARTVRRWPLLYPDRWAEAVRGATRRAVDDAAVEGTITLRQMLRAGKDNLKLQAAWHLLYQRLELTRLELQAASLAPPPPPSDAQLIAAFVEGHSRDQLIRLAAHLLNARVPQRLAVPADAAAGGS